MVHVLAFLIRSYQKIGRSVVPPSCRFYPTCSQYAIEALQQHGAVKGSLKALWRIARCSPLSKGGYDPVK
jgi:putative membrane protein insertion efficiency factor